MVEIELLSIRRNYFLIINLINNINFLNTIIQNLDINNNFYKVRRKISFNKNIDYYIQVKNKYNKPILLIPVNINRDIQKEIERINYEIRLFREMIPCSLF